VISKYQDEAQSLEKQLWDLEGQGIDLGTPYLDIHDITSVLKNTHTQHSADSISDYTNAIGLNLIAKMRKNLGLDTDGPLTKEEYVKSITSAKARERKRNLESCNPSVANLPEAIDSFNWTITEFRDKPPFHLTPASRDALLAHTRQDAAHSLLNSDVILKHVRQIDVGIRIFTILLIIFILLLLPVLGWAVYSVFYAS